MSDENKPAVEDLYSISGNKQLLKRLLQHVETGNVVPFVGAGMSIPLGYPGWSGFLAKLAREYGLEDKVLPLLETQQFEEAAHEVLQAIGEGQMNIQIDDAFADRTIPPVYAGTLTCFPLLFRSSVITTNFDHVLENFYRGQGKAFDSKLTGQEAEKAIREALAKKRVLIKLHGDIDYVAGRILSREDYDKHYGPGDALNEQLPLPQLLRQVISANCLLFIGCSLATDRTLAVLKEVKHDTSLVPRFAIVERPDDMAARNRKVKQLEEHGIRPIWYPAGRHEYVHLILRHLNDSIGPIGPEPPPPPPPPPPKWTVAAIYGALGLALMLALFIPWFSAGGFDEKEVLRVGIVMNSDWDEDVARDAFRSFIKKLNTRLSSAKREGDLDYALDPEVEALWTFQEALEGLKRTDNPLDLVGELSPREIYAAHEAVEAVPVLSPMYGDSGVYEGVIVVGNWWLREEGGELALALPAANAVGDDEDRPIDLSIKPEIWRKVIETATGTDGKRIALMNHDSTSGYWYPRKAILQELDDRTPFAKVVKDAYNEEETLLDEVSKSTGSIFAGAVAAWRFQKSAHRNDLTVVQRIPLIPNGGFVLREGLAANKSLARALRQNWENAVRDYLQPSSAPAENGTQANGSSLPHQLKPSPFPEHWAAVDLSNYENAFGVFRIVDPVQEQKRLTTARFVVAGMVLLVVLCAAALLLKRGRGPVDEPA